MNRANHHRKNVPRAPLARFGRTVPLLGAVLLLAPRAYACAVCFGNPDDKMTKGMLAGVLVLLLVVLAVLGGFVALFVYLARRSAMAAALQEQPTHSRFNQ